MPQQGPPYVGESRSGGAALDDGAAYQRLELRNVLGKGRLGEAQGARRAANASRVVHRNERAQ